MLLYKRVAHTESATLKGWYRRKDEADERKHGCIYSPDAVFAAPGAATNAYVKPVF